MPHLHVIIDTEIMRHVGLQGLIPSCRYWEFLTVTAPPTGCIVNKPLAKWLQIHRS